MGALCEGYSVLHCRSDSWPRRWSAPRPVDPPRADRYLPPLGTLNVDSSRAANGGGRGAALGQMKSIFDSVRWMPPCSGP